MHSSIIRRDNFHLRLFCVSMLFMLTTANVDLYAILGVPKNVESKDLTKAFRKLAMKWHPDKHSMNKELASKKFMAIRTSYEILKNPSMRQVYDDVGTDWVLEGEDPMESGMQMQTHTQSQSQTSDIFSKEWEWLLNYLRQIRDAVVVLLLLGSSIIIGL